MKRIIFSFFIFALLGLPVFSKSFNKQIGDSQKAYRDALFAFDSNEYGKALNYAEDAILFRKQEIEYETNKLKESLSSREVNKAGDNIESILKVLTERKETVTINIINSYIKVKGNDYFNNSISQLLAYMNSLSVYPEAQKLIGDIYKLEGEYDYAEQYYLMALDNASVFDIPDEKYEILYMLAEISEFENDNELYEIRLLNILAEDENYGDKSLRKAMINTISRNATNSVEKFFSLYRAYSYLSLNAYIKLADYYFEIGELKKALEFSAMATITSYTKISKSLESRNIDYVSSSLSVFLQECSFYDDIIKWGSDNNVWSCFNSLAKIAKANGYSTFAQELLIILVKDLPEPYWQKDAVLLLEKME